MTQLHEYRTQLIWQGGQEGGTSSYAAYGRNYRILVDGKPDLDGSADPVFRGDPARHNPEDLFVAAISACHMLTYLALCARSGIHVVAYRDAAVGRMDAATHGGRFVEVVLRPEVTIVEGDADLAARLHDDAHAQCFVANSCRVPIHHQSTIRAGGR